MTSPIPRGAIDATAPTSRSTFRLLAGCIDATNRDADTLRHALLSQWAEHAGADDLVRRLRERDPAAFQCLNERYLPSVWRFVFTRVDGDSHLAEDIVSETVFGLLYGFLWFAHWPALVQWLACGLFLAGVLASIRAHQ